MQLRLQTGVFERRLLKGADWCQVYAGAEEMRSWCWGVGCILWAQYAAFLWDSVFIGGAKTKSWRNEVFVMSYKISYVSFAAKWWSHNGGEFMFFVGGNARDNQMSRRSERSQYAARERLVRRNGLCGCFGEIVPSGDRSVDKAEILQHYRYIYCRLGRSKVCLELALEAAERGLKFAFVAVE